MDIHKMDRAELEWAHGLESKRLLPWPELNAPFEGAWCMVPPGGESAAHSHHEYEIFIAMTGRSTLVVDGTKREFAAGDVARLEPGSHHQVVNDSAEPFEFYGIWWDPDMSAAFFARHLSQPHPDHQHADQQHSDNQHADQQAFDQDEEGTA